jgi:haloacetate dehalogenase
MTHDAEDFGRRKIACPVLALWGKKGKLDAWYDVLAVWRDWASDVRGRAIECGHYLAEEAPDATCDELERFFSAA